MNTDILYKDDDPIQVLKLKTLYENALRRYEGIKTVGDLKACIREYRLGSICYIGKKGIQMIIERLIDQEADDELGEALIHYRNRYEE